MPEGLNPQAQLALDALKPGVKPVERATSYNSEPMVIPRGFGTTALSESARQALEELKPKRTYEPEDHARRDDESYLEETSDGSLRINGEEPQATNTVQERQPVPPRTFTPEEEARLMEFHERAIGLLESPKSKTEIVIGGVKRVAEGIRQSDIDFRNEVKQEAADKLAEKMAKEQIKAREQAARRRLQSMQNRREEQERQQRAQDQAMQTTEEQPSPTAPRIQKAVVARAKQGFEAIKSKLQRQPQEAPIDMRTRPPERQPVQISPEVRTQVDNLLQDINNQLGNIVRTEILERQLGDELGLPQDERIDAADRETENYMPWQNQEYRILRALEYPSQRALADKLFSHTSPDLQQAADRYQDTRTGLLASTSDEESRQKTDEVTSAKQAFGNQLDQEAGCTSQQQIQMLEEKALERGDGYFGGIINNEPVEGVCNEFALRNKTRAEIARTTGENSKKRVTFLTDAAERAGLAFSEDPSGWGVELVEKPTAVDQTPSSDEI